MSPSLKGALITETLPYDGGRQVTAYVPPTSATAIVFSGDGHLISQWASALEAATASAVVDADLNAEGNGNANRNSNSPSTILVGAHRAEDEDQRLAEYSPAFDAARFAAHKNFLLSDVMTWSRARLNASFPALRTAIHGVSAGAELALALGLERPDLFGAVLCVSPGAGFRPSPEELKSALPRVYLLAGTQEPFFLENARRWEKALRDAGAEVCFAQRDGEHGGAFWGKEVPRMVEWAFGSTGEGKTSAVGSTD